MAMNPVTLQATLLTVFNAMNSMPTGGNAYKASNMAAALKTFTLTGQVSTEDTGAAPAGAYKGAGAGTMTIDADKLSSDLLETFEAKYPNDDLADHMAIDIDNACKTDKTIKTTSAGTVTTPVGATSPFSGPGEGKFSGSNQIIASALKACFSTMNSMVAGGNEYYATQLATAYYSYLKAGTISVTLKSPFASGSGSGAIT